MWSTVTETLFFAPQSLANLSNQMSYSGTKCAHCTIDSALSAASAFDTNGADSIGAVPAAAIVRPVFVRNRRLVTRGIFDVLISVSLPVVGWMRRVRIKDFASSTSFVLRRPA